VRFASRDEESGIAAPLRAMTRESSEVLEGGALWLRYKLEKRLTHLFARRQPGWMRESRRDLGFDIKPLCLHAVCGHGERSSGRVCRHEGQKRECAG